MKKLNEYKDFEIVAALNQMNDMVENLFDNTDMGFENLNPQHLVYGTPKRLRMDYEAWHPALYAATKTDKGVHVSAKYRGEIQDFEFELLVTPDKEANYEAFADKYWPDDEGYEEDEYDDIDYDDDDF